MVGSMEQVVDILEMMICADDHDHDHHHVMRLT